MVPGPVAQGCQYVDGSVGVLRNIFPSGATHRKSRSFGHCAAKTTTCFGGPYSVVIREGTFNLPTCTDARANNGDQIRPIRLWTTVQPTCSVPLPRQTTDDILVLQHKSRGYQRPLILVVVANLNGPLLDQPRWVPRTTIWLVLDNFFSVFSRSFETPSLSTSVILVFRCPVVYVVF
jgi:hypothetical protein